MSSPNESWSSSNAAATFPPPTTTGTTKPNTNRKRTRATAEQLAVLEDTFSVNVSPNAKHRKQLSEQLGMSERSIQIWFQNRRAKVKHMQKRAQMQMQQAAMRAQMFHQQQQQQYYYPYMWLQQQQQQQQQQLPTSLQQHRPSFSRAQSVDAIQRSTAEQVSFLSEMPATTTDWTSGDGSALSMIMSRQSMPPHIGEYDSFLMPHTAPTTMVPIPDAGPTVMLSNQLTPPPIVSAGSTSSNSSGGGCFDLDDLLLTRGTIDPSEVFKKKDKMVILGATTLTIGTWQRLALSATDLVCTYRDRQLAWHIDDNGLQYKVQFSLDALRAIEFSEEADNTSAEVHFDLHEAPLFYMMTSDKQWIQCSDFTEGGQATTVLRHTIKGIPHQLKQDLASLMSASEEASRLIHFAAGQPSDLLLTASTALSDFLSPSCTTFSYHSFE
ncbi:hypothetical protein BJV82DRAFT_583795 [Fennellomyces sp. T-0311]|nr:hypothetical protein BJV82DRAFT_583795 [Fennellomyces sp. T-0311]